MDGSLMAEHVLAEHALAEQVLAAYPPMVAVSPIIVGGR